MSEAATVDTSGEAASEAVDTSETLEPAEGLEETPEDGSLEGDAETEPDDGEEPERYTIKVAGEEQSLTLDELTTLAQKGSGAEKRFEEAAEMRKQFDAEKRALAKELQGDPFVRAYLTGGRDAMFKAIAEEMEYEALPEDERRAKDERRELEAKAKRADELDAKQKETETAAQVQAYQAQFLDSMPKALAAAGAPTSPAAIRRMSTLMLDALESGAQVSLESLAEQTRDELRGDALSALPSEAEALIELLGADRVKALLAHETKRLRGRQANIKRTRGGTQPAHKPGKTRVVGSDFFAKLRGE